MIKVERSSAAPDLLLWNQKRKMEVTGNKMLLSSLPTIFMRSVIFARSNLCRIPRLNTDCLIITEAFQPVFLTGTTCFTPALTVIL